jgi:hypothetical protein
MIVPENKGSNYREHEYALEDRVRDAEILLRYFMRRDEMNAEIHNMAGSPEPDVRYSPITIAAERVVGWLWQELYIDKPLSLLYR